MIWWISVWYAWIAKIPLKSKSIYKNIKVRTLELKLSLTSLSKVSSLPNMNVSGYPCLFG